ncbi:MAG: Opr family porin [Verrucomicrobiota bacterium]|nr:Opr family porin [Verrucomicrobiota bacterium]
MQKKITVLFSLTLLFALTLGYSEGVTLGKAGTLSGRAGIYYSNSFATDSENATLTHSYQYLNFESIELAGLKLGVGFFTIQELMESDDNVYSNADNEDFGNRDGLTQLYLNYSLSKTSLTMGRFEGGMEYNGDYYDGIQIISEEIDGLKLSAIWYNRAFEAGDPTDIIQNRPEEIADGDDTYGEYGFEAEYTGIEDLTLIGMYYTAELFDCYGCRATYEFEAGIPLTIMGESYRSNEEGDNGNLYHVCLSASPIDSLTLSTGYFELGEKAGYANIVDDPWDVLESDAQEEPGAKTCYISAEYAIHENLTLIVLYGEVNYDSTDANQNASNAKEFVCGCEYCILEGLSLSVNYVAVDGDSTAITDYNEITANLCYEF